MIKYHGQRVYSQPIEAQLRDFSSPVVYICCPDYPHRLELQHSRSAGQRLNPAALHAVSHALIRYLKAVIPAQALNIVGKQPYREPRVAMRFSGNESIRA